MKHTRAGGLIAAALTLALAACGNQPTAEPPAVIARACVSTGQEVLYAPEWVKPLMGRHVTSWQTTDGEDVIFRVEKANPLNGTTTVVSLLFAPVVQPVVQAPYCQGYYEPVLLDVDGEEQPVGPLKAQVFGLHMYGTRHDGIWTPFRNGGGYTLEFVQ
jgi:hypothetical protein